MEHGMDNSLSLDMLELPAMNLLRGELGDEDLTQLDDESAWGSGESDMLEGRDVFDFDCDHDSFLSNLDLQVPNHSVGFMGFENDAAFDLVVPTPQQQNKAKTFPAPAQTTLASAPAPVPLPAKHHRQSKGNKSVPEKMSSAATTTKRKSISNPAANVVPQKSAFQGMMRPPQLHMGPAQTSMMHAQQQQHQLQMQQQMHMLHHHHHQHQHNVGPYGPPPQHPHSAMMYQTNPNMEPQSIASMPLTISASAKRKTAKRKSAEISGANADAAASVGSRHKKMSTKQHRSNTAAKLGEPTMNSLVTAGANNAMADRTKQTSSFRGVSCCGKDRKWQARIRDANRVRYLGRFSTEVEAALVYDDAARALKGDKAPTNFVKMDESAKKQLRLAVIANNGHVPDAMASLVVRTKARQAQGKNMPAMPTNGVFFPDSPLAKLKATEPGFTPSAQKSIANTKARMHFGAANGAAMATKKGGIPTPHLKQPGALRF